MLYKIKFDTWHRQDEMNPEFWDWVGILGSIRSPGAYYYGIIKDYPCGDFKYGDMIAWRNGQWEIIANNVV